MNERGVERINLVGYGESFVFAGDGLTTRVIYCYAPIEKWIACISANQIELVAFEQSDQAGLPSLREAAVMRQYPEQFTLVFSDKHVHIYRVSQ